MNLGSLITKEIRARPATIAACVLVIALGVAALVAIRHVAVASQQAVSRQLSALGANVLILPKGTTLGDYYAADLHGQTVPEEHVSSVLLAMLPGVEKLSPKLCVPVRIGEHEVTLTGILPQSEFQAAAAWQSIGMFSNKHVGCKKAACGPKTDSHSPDALATERAIAKLGEKQAILGADVAERCGLATRKSIELLGESFEVLAILPHTGTIDDSRVFAHLHTVQRLAKAGEVVSAIEVLACCDDAAGQLVPRLAELLPDCRIVTIAQVVETQVGVNRLLGSLCWFVLVILVMAGGTSIAAAIAANVRERRREIGTLMALGATPGFVARLFLLKALALGTFGGVAGAALGLLAAMAGGPLWAGIAVSPLPAIIALAIAATALVSVIAALFPARTAARLDPCCSFRET
jgi:putative ABC transport system permease protein